MFWQSKSNIQAYKVNFTEDNFAIHITSKFHIHINSKISFAKFAILGTQIRENIFRKNIFPQCALKFEGNKCGRVKLLGRVLRKSGKVLRWVLKKVEKIRVGLNKNGLKSSRGKILVAFLKPSFSDKVFKSSVRAVSRVNFKPVDWYGHPKKNSPKNERLNCWD